MCSVLATVFAKFVNVHGDPKWGIECFKVPWFKGKLETSLPSHSYSRYYSIAEKFSRVYKHDQSSQGLLKKWR